VAPGLLAPAQCEALAALWADESAFRSPSSCRTRYGAGEYRYFRYRCRPDHGAARALYPPLAKVANAWAEALAKEERYPPTLKGWLRRCHAGDQTKPTPLLLRLWAGRL